MDTLNQTHGYKRSQKYKAIATEPVLERLKERGFLINSIVETKPRVKAKHGYQKHMIRLQHVDQVTNGEDERLELVLVNSADGSTSLKFMVGVFRMICENGLIVGDSALEFRVRHIGNPMIKIDEAVDQITHAYPLIAAKISNMKNRELTDSEIVTLATKVAHQMLPSTVESYDLQSVLKAKRLADRGNDLWRVLNRIQENAIRGGIEYKTLDKDHNLRHSRTRAVRAIDTQVKLNKLIWNEAEALLAA